MRQREMVPRVCHDRVDVKFSRRMMDDVAKNFGQYSESRSDVVFLPRVVNNTQGRVRVTPTDDNVQSAMLQHAYALLH